MYNSGDGSGILVRYQIIDVYMPTINITLHHATVSDAPALAALQRHVFAATYGAALPAATLDAYVGRTFATAQVAAEIARADTAHLLALYNGMLVGVSKLVRGAWDNPQHNHTAEIARLYVDARFHGQGVAALLLQSTLGMAREQGARTAWLCVWQHNPRAIAFYRKHGFVAFGHIPVFVDDIRFDDLLMRRTTDDC